MARKVGSPQREDGPAAKEKRIESYPQIRMDQGAPTLFIEGRAVVPVVMDLEPEASEQQIKACAAAGISLYRLRRSDLGWNAPQRWDYSDLERRVTALLAADAGARFWLEVSVDAPGWWCEVHPGECIRAAERAPSAPPRNLVASWASSLWRSETAVSLSRLAQHILRQPWSAHCIGIQITEGKRGQRAGDSAEGEKGRKGEGETKQEGKREEGRGKSSEAEQSKIGNRKSKIDDTRHPPPDAGPRMTERFRAFALDKYRRNTGLLKQGWDDPRADFGRIRCPSIKELEYTDRGVFRNPVRSRRVLDYFECLFSAHNEALLEFAGAIKRASNGMMLVGISYEIALGGNLAIPVSGFPEPLFDAPEIDFYVCAVTKEDLSLRTLTGSLYLRGKFLFAAAHDQVDPAVAALVMTHQAGLILPPTTVFPDTQTREEGREEEVNPKSKIQNPKSIIPYTLSSAFKGRRITEVAVIVDPAGAMYLGSGAAGQALLQQLEQQFQELAQLGAPFDVYMPADLFHPGFRDHKVYIFVNTFYFSEAERRRMDARVKRSEQTAVWLWAPGILSESGIGAESGQKVTGQRMRVEPGETSLKVRITESADPLTWGFHTGSTLGSESAFAPTITVADKQAKRLGANSANKTVFCVGRFANWTSVIYGTVPVPASLLRNMLRAAGCHLYLDAPAPDDVVMADSRSVGLASRRGGTKKLSLPGPCEVTNASTAESLGITSDLTIEMKPGESIYFLLKPTHPKTRR